MSVFNKTKNEKVKAEKKWCTQSVTGVMTTRTRIQKKCCGQLTKSV